MKKKFLKPIIGIIVVALVAGGGFIYLKNKKSTAASTAPNYISYQAKKMSLNLTVTGTGTVFASVTKDISSNNSGEVKDLSVKEGDTVKAGDKLFTAYSDTIDSQIIEDKIDLEKQQIALQSAQNSNSTASAQLAVDQAQMNLDDDIKARDAMTVTSPINGIITAKNLNNGDQTQSGKAVLSIMDTSSFKVKIQVDELDISKVQIGQSTEVTFDALEDKKYAGKVESISLLGNTSNNVTTYDVVVSLDDLTGIRMGMNGNATIQVTSKDNVLAISTEAITELNGKKYVMTSKPTSGATTTTTNSNPGTGRKSRSTGTTSTAGNLVEIKTGIVTQDYVEVTSGLTEGEQVLVAIPQTSSSSTAKNNSSAFGGSFSGGQGTKRPN